MINIDYRSNHGCKWINATVKEGGTTITYELDASEYEGEMFHLLDAVNYLYYDSGLTQEQLIEKLNDHFDIEDYYREKFKTDNS